MRIAAIVLASALAISASAHAKEQDRPNHGQAAIGGVTGAFGKGSRDGFVIGGAVTCTLDIVWIVSAEVLAKQARDDDGGLAFVEKSPDGWTLGPPPVVVTRRGAWISLFAWRF